MTASGSDGAKNRSRGSGKNKRKKKRAPAKTKSVYIIELDEEVLKHKRFRDKNPDHDPSKACLYVGKTGLTPEERFERHKAGVRSNSYVERYGKWLRTRMFERYNPMTESEAVRKEVELAEELRRKGYAVWQG